MTNEQFTTGSVRDSRKNKGRFDLCSPIPEFELARHLELGAEKYSERNWELGQPFSRVLDSALRHLNQFRQGQTNEDHLISAYCNLHFLIHYREMIKRGILPESLNDLPRYITDVS